MADLKKDLLNDLMSKKYFAEIELVRLAGDPAANYRKKINEMQVQLREIAILNAEVGLVGQYFQEQAPAAPAQVPQGTPVTGPPAGVVHPGQTHGE
jgi:hypothetical protein